MLDFKKILHYFSLFSDLSGEALEPWHGLCCGAAARVEARLDPELDGLDRVDMDRLCSAAAALAYGDFLMMGGDGAWGAEELRVGDIALKSSAGTASQDARDIVDYFMEQAADLLLPPYQALRSVES